MIQCKCYQESVKAGEVRKALAKIFVKRHSGEIPFQASRADNANNPWYFLPLFEQEKTEETVAMESH